MLLRTHLPGTQPLLPSPDQHFLPWMRHHALIVLLQHGMELRNFRRRFATVVDYSFIPYRLVLGHLAQLLSKGCLRKPDYHYCEWLLANASTGCSCATTLLIITV